MTAFPLFMSGWGWVVFSVISAAFSAVWYLTVQYYRQPGDGLVFWSRLVTVALMASFMGAVEMPRDPLFYLAVAGTALCAVLADVRTANVATRYGAGVVSRVQPLTVWGSFFLWLLCDPALLSAYARHPVNTFLILLTLSGCVVFAQRQNKCPITKQAMKEMMPALIAYSVAIVLSKYALGRGSVAGAAFGYMFVQSALALPLMGGILLWRGRGSRAALWPRPRAMIMAALLAGTSWVVLMTFKNYAMAFTPNPSYQTALTLTTPLFVSLYYHATGHKEEADVKAGMGVVACAILLALVTVG